MQLRTNEELAGENDEHVIAAVDYLLNYAFDQRASDIHLEPRDKDAVIRFRIDGILHDIEKLPLKVHGAITSRIKVLARMDIAERRRPQDGRIKTWRADREVELRVASLATAFGEKVVIRVFDPSVLMTDLARPRHVARGPRALRALDHLAARAWCSSPAPPARARPPRSTRRSATSRAPRSTSPPSRTRSRWSTRASARCRCSARST